MGVLLDFEKPFSERMVGKLPQFSDRARCINNNKSYEAYTGGPNHDWTGLMLDVLGTVYPELERRAREKGLKQCLKFLDELNYLYSQNHLELINEPWLVSDIVLNRPIYWCGYNEYCDTAKQNQSWKNFSEATKSVKSSFWLAMAVIRPEYTSLMDRTKDAVAAFAAVFGARQAQRENRELSACIDEKLSQYDPMLNSDIRTKIEEKKWIVL